MGNSLFIKIVYLFFTYYYNLKKFESKFDLFGCDWAYLPDEISFYERKFNTVDVRPITWFVFLLFSVFYFMKITNMNDNLNST